jgi:hypothetical protein
VQVSNASGRVSGLTNNTLYYFAVTAVKVATPPVLLNSKVTKLSLIKFLTGKSTSNGLPITSALILSILVFLNLSSKPFLQILIKSL